MFSVEETDSKDVYSDVENALDCFNTGDALQQRSRENNCNYEWADDIDVLNVLHSVNDWPVTLQVNYQYINRLISIDDNVNLLYFFLLQFIGN